ncbi:MAG: alpha/beta fold hydrolase, partial [Ktedonobacterales bacterium]|nr:alpha/beta fold hydrolase [Ktedonobacterales bacterium]
MEAPPLPDIACLLVHGLNGIRYDFDEIAQVLQDHGYATDQLLLPGHEVHAREARQFGWNDWSDALRDRFEEMLKQHARVVVIGHSMGGSLALSLAERDPRVAALVSLCAPTHLHASLVPIVRLGRYVLPYLP